MPPLDNESQFESVIKNVTRQKAVFFAEKIASELYLA